MTTKPKQTFIKPVFLALFGIVVTLTSCTNAHSEGMTKKSSLALPYDVPAYQKATQAPFSCPSPVAAPPVNLVYESVYNKSDPYRATPDTGKAKTYLKETAETRAFENKLLQMSNQYLQTGSPQKAQCVLNWLHHWAKGGALLGETNDMGVALRQWMLASLGSAYAQVRDEPSLNKKKRRTVEKWLSRCAKTVIADYPRDSTQGRKQNNHLYWAAWAVTITGVALNNPDYYGWGIDRAKNALKRQMQDDGTFPLEMARGQRALHYHIFSALPLIMIAETGERNGDHLYKIRNGILHRFVFRIQEGLRNPSYFEAESGIPQNDLTDLHPGHLAWMEAYNQRFPSPDIEQRLQQLRPLFLRRTGGDMTMLYQQKNNVKASAEAVQPSP